MRSIFKNFNEVIVALISLTNGYLSFSDAPLLDHAELHIEPNERVCLVGRNGAGKSTLLKIIAGDVTMDDGKVQYEKDLVVSRCSRSRILGNVTAKSGNSEKSDISHFKRILTANFEKIKRPLN